MKMMKRRWLLARRDALVDRALAYIVPAMLALAFTALESLPLPMLTGLSGLAVGVGLASIKKPELRLY